ncbi:DUF2147 domain-containing protein [Pseudotenacibaculum haliotis]|uniref:DUF2147 domain-containing protein n=1 Tax=Pseudotenacibaculum haliotis TaxID=1862138 RepID=A0ABW5LT93_9FLAO
MKKFFLFTFALLLSLTIHSQTIFGKWNSFDEETNKVESVIEVYEKDGKAYAKIIEITDPERKNATCFKCKGKRKDQPIVGMNILTGLKKKDDEWSGGKILDPKNGKEYKCYIKLLDDNTLKIRGYIGISLLGRTAIWKRVQS